MGTNPSVEAIAAAVRARPPRLGGVRLVCVDGPAGAGKSTLAQRLAAALGGAPVVHMDDLFEGWSGLDPAWPRLEEQVLALLRRGAPARYQRYDWVRQEFGETVEVAPPPALVLEGVSSGRREAARWASLLVWVDAPRDVRLARGVERDGEALRGQWLAWLDSEAAHFAAHATAQRADVVVDGTRPVPERG